MLQIYIQKLWMSFVKCLQLGKECEKTFMRYLIDYPGMISIEFAQWKFKDWDIKMTTKDKEITYEVKSDRKSEETWNCCIECMYKDEPSWVYASKADYIVMLDSDLSYNEKHIPKMLKFLDEYDFVGEIVDEFTK